MRHGIEFLLVVLVAGLCLAAVPASGQEGTVTAQIVTGRKDKRSPSQVEDTAVWLEPLDVPDGMPQPRPAQHAQLVQSGKQFHPRLLIIPVGTAVYFPNRDPFFHNVFSLFDGKRFDLGLYEAGTSRQVHFDRPGVSYIFCNIHSEMSAVVIAVATPYYASAGGKGQIVIPDVKPGRYRLHVWHQGTSDQALQALERLVTVKAGSTQLGKIDVPEDEAVVAHKNKYGRDYDEPVQPSYEHP